MCFARWRFCAYRAGVYAPFAGWIRRSHHPAAICRLVRVVVRVAAVVHQRAAGVNVAEDIHVARNHRAVSDAAAACHTAKPGEFFHHGNVAGKGAERRIDGDIQRFNARMGRFHVDIYRLDAHGGGRYVYGF